MACGELGHMTNETQSGPEVKNLNIGSTVKVEGRTVKVIKASKLSMSLSRKYVVDAGFTIFWHPTRNRWEQFSTQPD